MIELDVADLIVITGQVLGIGPDAALDLVDAAAAEAALAQARRDGQEAADAAARSHLTGSRPAGARPHRAVAAAAAVALVHALLRHPWRPGRGEQVAVAAGLQFLAVNGWQADLDVPGAAVVIVEGLASGRLTPADAASWLALRLSPHPDSPASEGSRRLLLPPGSAARRIVLTPVAAVRHRGRRSGPGPFVISLGSPGRPAGIRTPATGLMPFTDHARNAVVRSREEARRIGRPRGPEHMLLGLAGEGDCLAVKVLQRLGIGPGPIREEIARITSPGVPQVPAGRAPDTPQARRVWLAVLDEAVAGRDDFIGTEHLLLALFSDRDGAAAAALARLGAGENDVRGAIAALVAESGRERFA
jgi:hypothetical protein